MTPPTPGKRRLADIVLDEKTMVRRSPEVEHERQVAIFDLLEENSFSPHGLPDGPYHLHISVQENRLLFDIRDAASKKLRDVVLSLTPFRTVVKDYFLICESYYDAIKRLSPSQIEALDMGRRGLHNEGSELLRERLDGKIELDLDTARRLFTLICVLHIRAEPVAEQPSSVLFACTLNSVRSPMAEAIAKHLFGKSIYVDSVGVRAEDIDGFAIAVMEEIGIDLHRHHAKTFDDLEDSSFDLVITLSPEAQHRAVEMTRTMACEVEFWPTIDPSAIEGSREARLAHYRSLRDGLMARIKARFGGSGGPTV